MIKAVACSSCESEFMAAKRCVNEALWLRQLLEDMGYPKAMMAPTTCGKLCCKDYDMEQLTRLVDPAEKPLMLRDVPEHPPTLIGMDNQCAIAYSKNAVHSKRTKHIDISWHKTKQEVNRGTVRLKYVKTGDNWADLMTKALPRVTHEFLVTKMLQKRISGRLCRFDDKVEIELDVRPPVRDVLYTEPTPGLDMEDTLTGGRFAPRKVSAEAAPRIPSRARGVGVPGGGLPKSLRQAAAREALPGAVAAVVRESSGMLAAAATRDVLRAAVVAIVREMAASGSIVGARRARQIEAMAKAIIDSGATSDFGGRDLELDNAVPGEALVAVANDLTERVKEKGDVYPLEEVRKVESFPRPLVSVRKLVAKYKSVVFNDAGVHVRTPCNGGKRCIAGVRSTKIGELGKDNLYGFDLRALTRHARCGG